MEPVAGLEQARRIKKNRLAAGASENPEDSVSGGLRLGSYDRQALLEESVEEGGLTGVGATYERCVAAADFVADIESGRQWCRTSESESS